MERDFLKQSIRRELDYYRDGLFNEDGDEEWVRAWSAPDDDDSMAENGFLNVAMAHLAGDECDEIVLLGTEYGYHQPDYDSYIDIGAAFVNDMSTGFLDRGKRGGLGTADRQHRGYSGEKPVARLTLR